MKGSVALISVLIISAFTLILVVGMSEVNISSSYQHFNNVSDKVSYYTGEACLEEAMIRLENDISFTNGSLVFDADTTCSITISGSQIDLTVNFLDFTQHFRADINLVTNGQASNVTLLKFNKI